MTEKEALVAMNMVPGLGALRGKSLLRAFGSARAVLAAPRSRLLSVERIGAEIGKRITEWRSYTDPARELSRAEELGIEIICLSNPSYPEQLRNIPDPPLVIYLKGELLPEDHNAVAVVGSRRPSFYGRMTTERLSAELGERGMTVVSGMARGIDTAAHRGALRVGARTIAVLGSGIDVVYPPENKKMMKDIARTGAVVSEFPLGTQPDRQNFPRRNRIISGLSLGVVVVEAAGRSGSLITVASALDQGREVFSVPGKVDSPQSQGTNRLIKEGAKLVETVDDILEELQGQLREELREVKVTAVAARVQLSEGEKRVIRELGNEPRHADEISRSSGLAVSQVSSTLLTLELRKLVKALPGRMYVRALGRSVPEGPPGLDHKKKQRGKQDE